MYLIQVEIEYTVEKSAMPRPSSRVDMLKADGRGSPSSRSESPVSTTDTRRPNTEELVTVVADSYRLVEEVRQTAALQQLFD